MKNETSAFHDFWVGFCMLAFAGACAWSWWDAGVLHHDLLYTIGSPIAAFLFLNAAGCCFFIAWTKLKKRKDPG